MTNQTTATTMVSTDSRVDCACERDKKTTELTTASALFIRGMLSDGLGYHRSADAHGKHECNAADTIEG
jgi:hypothetical protein